MDNAFFIKDIDDNTIYHPTPLARGPWDPKTLHGRVLSGLVAYDAEANCLSEEDAITFQPSRITADLFRPPPMSPLIVTSEVIRSGKRIKVIDVKIAATVEGRGVIDVARGNVVLLKKSENPEGDIWTPPAWSIEPPDEDKPFPQRTDFGTNERGSHPIWETVNIQDDVGVPYIDNSPRNRPLGIRRAWVRETYNFVSGEPTSQLVRIAQVADFANPFTNSGTKGLSYINADVVLYLHRTPIGSWIGIETSYHGSEEGVSVGTMSLYDKLGRVGTSTVCGLTQVHP